MSHPPGPGDALGRWLLGGLAAGAVVLGLMAAAYAVGYNRGQDSDGQPAAAATTTAPATTTSAAAPAPTGGSAARGKELFATGCSACHSLGAEGGVGPGLGGVAGSTVTLDDGSTVTADDAYLARSLTDSDAQIVKGYKPGIMPAAVAPLHLDQNPDDVASLVAFLKQQR